MDTPTMDLDDPGRDVQAGRKSRYPDEFRKDAVTLHHAAAGKRTHAAVAADLGITAESLRTWVGKDEAQGCPDVVTRAKRGGGAGHARFGGKRICRVLGVSRSGDYRHVATAWARAERRA
ncbi:transposase [Streptomyces sp. NPDC002092]